MIAQCLVERKKKREREKELSTVECPIEAYVKGYDISLWLPSLAGLQEADHRAFVLLTPGVYSVVLELGGASRSSGWLGDCSLGPTPPAVLKVASAQESPRKLARCPWFCCPRSGTGSALARCCQAFHLLFSLRNPHSNPPTQSFQPLSAGENH